MVSFEYVIVAACIVAAVAAAFGTGGTGPITTALTSAITAIAAKVTSAARLIRPSGSGRGAFGRPPRLILQDPIDESDSKVL